MKSQDEITAARKRKRRKYRRRRLVAVAVLVVLVACIILIADNINMYTFRSVDDFIKVSFAKKVPPPILLGSSKPVKIAQLKGAYAVLSERELVVKANRGAELLRSVHGYSNPIIQAGKTRILLYNAGSRSYSIYDRTKELLFRESEYAIVSGAVSSKGMAAILTRGDRSLSQLEVLSEKDYLTYFTWYGTSGYPLSCGFSNSNNELYVATVSADRNGMFTVFTVIDTDKRQQKAEVKIPGIMMKTYPDGSKYTIVTDKGVFLINDKYEKEAEYRFPDIPVLRLSKEGRYLAIAFGDNNSADVNFIVILSDTLKEQAVIDNTGVVDDIYMSTDRLYLLGSGRVFSILPDGKYVGICETELKAKKIFLIKNRVYVAMQDRLELIKMQGIQQDKE